MIRIFLSYAHEDLDKALKIYHALNSYPGVDVWLDKESLLPGQRWEQAIRQAIRSANYFIVLLSRHSVGKKGFYQREIRLALEVLDEYPDDHIFLIPARLEECELHFERLLTLQYVDLFPDWNKGISRIEAVLRLHIRGQQSSPSTDVRLTVHRARFARSLGKFYFVNVTNRATEIIEITHVWYEDHDCHIRVNPWSRPLPVRLEVNEAWSTWLPITAVPEAFRHNAYDKFRIRLSTGELFESRKEDTVPPYGSAPGGRVDPRDFALDHTSTRVDIDPDSIPMGNPPACHVDLQNEHPEKLTPDPDSQIDKNGRDQ